ncbi:SAM-dependent methyltransferase [Aestuariivirga litoralis]|uniref:SAM-dependent methyltransferase n=1 Tax=Aestuariivirga litoralis TaxID=2650924 RepID=A0A2W2AKZ4_9HYPH|nr:class I SAM-dependent methyltransferase [Aestuariivirga litoralis]PZF76215.1 SAM-dependent methyltransferase [Aestuariivirga litoralis]
MAEARPDPRLQQWSAGSYDTHARFVSDLASGVVDWLAPRAGERILDVGCGDGVLTAELRDRGVDVVGVDSSADFIAAAQARGLDARLMDGEALAFGPEFDAVFSNAALHWMPQADDVVAGIARALKPGGRFVAEFGGHGNVAAIVTAMRAVGLSRGGDLALANPWYFPAPQVYQAVLERHGFSVSRIALIPRPVVLKTGIEGWLMLFRKPFFAQFGANAQQALAETVDLLRPALCDAEGNWTADYVRLRVEAVKP